MIERIILITSYVVAGVIGTFIICISIVALDHKLFGGKLTKGLYKYPWEK